jgi:hypothetical protein
MLVTFEVISDEGTIRGAKKAFEHFGWFPHELYQKFRKEYMIGFAKIINCTKDFESVFDNHQPY